MFALFTLIACNGPDVGYTGTKMDDYFPMEGDRQATYVNDDAAVEYKLEMEKVIPTETADGLELVTFEYYRDDTYSLVGSVTWSNRSGDVKIHRWAGADGVTETFDTPVQVTDPSGYWRPGADPVVTQTNGRTFTSTFVDVQDCPVVWGLDWENCVHLTLDDGDGDPNAGPIFAGEYWLVTRYMIAWMKITGYGEKWNLADYDYDTGGI